MQIFIALILFAFLALFVVLSFPMSLDEMNGKEKSKPRSTQSE
ncbi:MAG: hypothetical protein AAFN11_22830 [Chloroflexota bacterium]